MKTLVWVEHDGSAVKDATLAAVTAASKLGEVHLLVAGQVLVFSFEIAVQLVGMAAQDSDRAFDKVSPFLLSCHLLHFPCSLFERMIEGRIIHMETVLGVHHPRMSVHACSSRAPQTDRVCMSLIKHLFHERQSDPVCTPKRRKVMHVSTE